MNRPHLYAALILLTVTASSLSPVPYADRAAQAAESGATESAGIASDVADPRDWPYCRGPESNGISRETGLIDDFDPRGGEGSNVAWMRDDLGGRSTPIVLNRLLYTLVRDQPETKREGEKVVCLDIETGETLWESRFNVWLSDVPDTRVGWSSVIGDPETGYVYALGVCGFFQCLDGKTGERLWSVPMHERFGLLSTYGGRTNFPVICDDLVIISGVIIGWGEAAKPGHRFLAFDKRTGEVVWSEIARPLPDDTTYSAPNLTVLGGEKALVVGSGDGQLRALQPRTGVSLWHYDFSMRGLSVSPLVTGDTVYMSQSEENVKSPTTMGGVVAVNGALRGDITETGELWRVEGLAAGKSSPLLLDGLLYCVDDKAKLHILDAETGEESRRPANVGTRMAGRPLYADGKIYIFTETGRWQIVQPDPRRGVRIISTGREMKTPGGETQNCLASPICSHGRIFLQTDKILYCLQDPSKTPGLTPRAAPPQESPVSEDPQPAHVQIVPADLLSRPGTMRTFRVRLFNSRGQFLRETPARFELDGPGSISEDGVFEAVPDAGHTATIVRARVGDLTGLARVRVVPDLPWSFDFEGLSDPPITWVGARYRHVVREIDGNRVMVKVTTIPKGARSRCWFGHSDLHDYTIQADVMSAIQNEKTPDIGLIAQGYTLGMLGEGQKLQIRSWDSQLLRMGRTIEFSWTPDTWYVLKMQVSDQNGRAVVRGKVWPREASEPAEWTIEAEDEAPTVSGSPGLFGDAKNAEIQLDNIRVFPN